MNDSARSGLELLAERGDARGADAVLGQARGAVRRRRARARAVLVAGLLLVVGVIAGIVVARGGNEHGRELATQPTSDVPPADAGPVDLYLSERVLPTAGGEVMVILRNTSNVDEQFSVPIWLERWDGTAWQELQRFPAADQPVQAIAYGVEANGVGSPERVTVPVLDAGWYRLRKESLSTSPSVTAVGTFEVVDWPVTPIDLPLAGEDLALTPALVAPGETSRLSVALVVSHSSPAGYDEQLAAQLSTDAQLARWTGDHWEDTAALAFIEERLDTPADLGPGAYRVTRATADGRELHGYFFVDAPDAVADPDAPPTNPAPVRLYLSDTVIPSTGADVIVIVRNDSATEVTFGLEAVVERWDGAAWSAVQDVGSPLLPGLAAPAGGVGPAQRLTIPPLAPGWYRVRKSATGATVSGNFRVVGQPASTVDLGRADVDHLVVAPALVRASCSGCSVRLGLARSPDYRGPQGPDAWEASLDDGARLDRWTGTGWQEVADLDFSIEGRVDWSRQPGERLAELPANLTPGGYRVLRTGKGGGELAGVFFVE